MSQKHVVGIVATAFVAGLLVTAMVHRPQGLSGVYQPYFGFADESGGAATKGPARSWWQTMVSSSADRPVVTGQAAKNWMSWDALVDVTRQVFRLQFSQGQTPGVSRPAVPPEQFLADATATESGFGPSWSMASSVMQIGEQADMVAGLPSPSGLLGQLPPFSTVPQQPIPKMLTHQEMASLEQLAHRSGPGQVAVTAFRGQAAEAQSDVGADGQQNAVSDELPPELKPLEPAPAATEPMVVDEQKADKEPVSPQQQPEIIETESKQTGEPVASNDPGVSSTQGHVARETEVASPDSLRALVSRTQPAALAETVDTATTSRQIDQTPAEVTAAATVTANPNAPDTDPLPKTSQSAKPIGRSERTARGLQSAAAALERVEQQPVESLLTRMLGQPAPKPVPVAKQQAKVPLPQQHLSPQEVSRDDTIRRPAHWEEEGRMRLKPRHARPQTATAPAPPLQLGAIGKPPQESSPIAASAGKDTGKTAWIDTDGEDWAEAVTGAVARQPVVTETPRQRIVRRLSHTADVPTSNSEIASPPPPAPEPPVTESLPAAAEATDEPPVRRLLDRLRPAERLRDRFGQHEGGGGVSLHQPTSPQTAWPPPSELLQQLATLAAEASPRPAAYQGVREWADGTTAAIYGVLATAGPHMPAAGEAVARFAACVPAGMAIADQLEDTDHASELRRVVFAVKRRAVTWQAVTALAVEWRNGVAAEVGLAEVEQATAELVGLLSAVEKFEGNPRLAQAAEVQRALAVVTAVAASEGGDISRAISDNYAAPNLRVSLREDFLTLWMPEVTSRTESLRETVLGRPVRGQRVVEQTTSIRLSPDPDEICFDLVVAGDISTYGITDAGPISMASRGAGQFTVQKPVKIGQQGLVVGPATASASNRARLMNVSTSFDSVPLMGSLLRTLARNQHAENLPAANREVAQKIVWQSCRETNEESERKFAELAEQIEAKAWNPLLELGLNPSPFMETTEEEAILRLRLHADTQLAAHTPRPREPEGSLLGIQVHQSTFNNAFDRLGIGGQQLSLEELFVRVQERLGLEPKVPDDIPEGVSVTFEAVDPIRVEFNDGLVEIQVAIDALESGRRDWYDVIGRVSYKPVVVGNRILLERDGPIRIGGPGHRGRIEFALRTIFGKIFPKERPLPVLPKKITDHPRLQELVAAQAVSWDGWFAVALADPSSQQLEATVASGQEQATRR